MSICELHVPANLFFPACVSGSARNSLEELTLARTSCCVNSLPSERLSSRFSGVLLAVDSDLKGISRIW